MKKRVLSLLLTVLMIVALIPCYAAAAGADATQQNVQVFSDMPGDWSAEALEKAVNNGLLTVSDGKIMPSDHLTRAQMATVISRVFGSARQASLNGFTDVSPDKWYYTDMGKVVQMGVFSGSGGKLNPENHITREEVFTALARAFKISGGVQAALEPFSDHAGVSAWAKDAVASLVSAGYVSGSNGLLNPKKYITRAEFAQLLDNILKKYFNKAGTYTGDVSGNVMVNVPDVVLKEMTISGDLIIGDGVEDGNVTLDSVTVTGRTVIRGGGVNSVKIIGSSSLGNIVVARVDGQVRVYSEDGTEIGEVTVDGRDDVIIEGNAGTVTVIASDITVTATNANITAVRIDGVNSRIIIGKDSKIDNVAANGSGIDISGEGTVGSVRANANNVTVSTVGTKVTAAEGMTGVMAGSIPVGEENTETVPGGNPNYTGYYPSPPSAPPDTVLETDARYFIYQIDDVSNSITITSYDTAGGLDVVIPSSIEGIPVVHIGDNAFRAAGGDKKMAPMGGWEPDENQLTSVVIPNGVTSIGKSSFERNRLTEIVIPSSVTSIGKNAFYRNSLATVNISDGVENIGPYTFSNNQIIELTLPDSLTTIGECAFTENSLTEVLIPTGVTSIGRFAFHGCAELKSINVASENSNYSSADGVLFNKDKTVLIQFPVAHDQVSYDIPVSVTHIGEQAFYNCTKLASVSVPDSVIDIGVSAFYYCIELTGVAGGSNVTSIGEAAFANCGKLESITIASGVTSIGGYTFDSCSMLDSVNVPGNVTSIGNYAFSNCTSLVTITLPDSIETLGMGAFTGSGLTGITLPDSVTSIGDYAFNGCADLADLTISNQIKSIGTLAFSHCSALETLVIPSGVISIGYSSFSNCTNLTSVTITAGVAGINNYAFYNCTQLTEVILPDSVSSIGDASFLNCPLTRITIGNSVTIGSSALADGSKTANFNTAYAADGAGIYVYTYDEASDTSNWIKQKK